MRYWYRLPWGKRSTTFGGKRRFLGCEPWQTPPRFRQLLGLWWRKQRTWCASTWDLGSNVGSHVSPCSWTYNQHTTACYVSMRWTLIVQTLGLWHWCNDLDYKIFVWTMSLQRWRNLPHFRRSDVQHTCTPWYLCSMNRRGISKLMTISSLPHTVAPGQEMVSQTWYGTWSIHVSSTESQLVWKLHELIILCHGTDCVVYLQRKVTIWWKDSLQHGQMIQQFLDGHLRLWTWSPLYRPQRRSSTKSSPNWECDPIPNRARQKPQWIYVAPKACHVGNTFIMASKDAYHYGFLIPRWTHYVLCHATTTWVDFLCMGAAILQKLNGGLLWHSQPCKHTAPKFLQILTWTWPEEFPFSVLRRWWPLPTTLVRGSNSPIQSRKHGTQGSWRFTGSSLWSSSLPLCNSPLKMDMFLLWQASHTPMTSSTKRDSGILDMSYRGTTTSTGHWLRMRARGSSRWEAASPGYMTSSRPSLTCLSLLNHLKPGICASSRHHHAGRGSWNVPYLTPPGNERLPHMWDSFTRTSFNFWKPMAWHCQIPAHQTNRMHTPVWSVLRLFPLTELGRSTPSTVIRDSVVFDNLIQVQSARHVGVTSPPTADLWSIFAATQNAHQLWRRNGCGLNLNLSWAVSMCGQPCWQIPWSHGNLQENPSSPPSRDQRWMPFISTSWNWWPNSIGTHSWTVLWPQRLSMTLSTRSPSMFLRSEKHFSPSFTTIPVSMPAIFYRVHYNRWLVGMIPLRVSAFTYRETTTFDIYTL